MTLSKLKIIRVIALFTHIWLITHFLNFLWYGLFNFLEGLFHATPSLLLSLRPPHTHQQPPINPPHTAPAHHRPTACCWNQPPLSFWEHHHNYSRASHQLRAPWHSPKGLYLAISRRSTRLNTTELFITATRQRVFGNMKKKEQLYRHTM